MHVRLFRKSTSSVSISQPPAMIMPPVAYDETWWSAIGFVVPCSMCFWARSVEEIISELYVNAARVRSVEFLWKNDNEEMIGASKNTLRCKRRIYFARDRLNLQKLVSSYCASYVLSGRFNFGLGLGR